MNAMFATKDFCSQATLQFIRENILEKNLMNAIWATKDFHRQAT
jgi:hypothetical protein